METIKWKLNNKARNNGESTCNSFLSEEQIQRAWDFHKTFNEYQATPLRSLSGLAKRLQVGGIYIKDESYRFGLNAFKVLGGAYAIGNYLANRLNIPIEDLSFETLKSEETKAKLGEITFTTATDGNHGRGVAWAAQQLGQKAVIYMPKGSSTRRLENILATGAQGYITDLNYDEAVRLSSQKAKENGWVIIQDTAWDGYEEIPRWIMQGYATMAAEATEQLRQLGEERPTHVFLQAGVGSYAGAVQGFLASTYSADRPITVIVEPSKADCLYQSALADDGKPRCVGGDLSTIMAGLACGEPNPMAWEILDHYSDVFVSCPDYVAAKGMRILGNPLDQDERVISGESGAVTMGFLHFLLEDDHYSDLRKRLNLNENSKILLFNTEGDTDPDQYRRIVWDGLFPTPPWKEMD